MGGILNDVWRWTLWKTSCGEFWETNQWWVLRWDSEPVVNVINLNLFSFITWCFVRLPFLNYFLRHSQMSDSAPNYVKPPSHALRMQLIDFEFIRKQQINFEQQKHSDNIFCELGDFRTRFCCLMSCLARVHALGWKTLYIFVNKISLKWFSQRVNASQNKSSFYQSPARAANKEHFLVDGWRRNLIFGNTVTQNDDHRKDTAREKEKVQQTSTSI